MNRKDYTRRAFLQMSSVTFAGSLLPWKLRASAENKKASVIIDAANITGEVSPLIYGQFIEHLGRAIYGGIYEEHSPLSNNQGFRKDVLEKVKALQAPLLRYPGGTVTKIYHWKDGIGSKAQRPVRKNLIWGGEDNNHFGTDEFMQYCALTGSDPFITVNMSTGTAEEAADWVEYCNSNGNAYFAALRRKHGHTKPYNVKYWGLGNEEAAREDAGILQSPADYIERAWYYAKLMKLQDPDIALIMVGENEAWNKAILEELHPIADYISLHLYANSKPGQPASLFDSIASMEQRIKTTVSQIQQITPAKVEKFGKWYRFPPRKEKVKIALDEWGIWESGGHGVYNLEVDYNWNHALGVASFLNIFQRNAADIGLATWAQTVNVLAPIMTDGNRSVCQTVFYPLMMYRKLCGNQHLATQLQGPHLEGDFNHLPALDVSATLNDKTGELTLAVVNRDASAGIDVSLQVNNNEVGGDWEMHTLNASGIDAINTLQHHDKNVVIQQSRQLPATTTSVNVMPHSIVLLKARLKKS